MRRLIVFTRLPVPGRVKTRLIPALGPEGAATLHRAMTQHTLRWVRELQRLGGVAVEVHFTGGDKLCMLAEFGADLDYRLQPEGDLGRRLTAAFNDISEPTVVIGTDCPDLGAREVLQAFDMLAANGVVLGPADDGGYYLIGLNRAAPPLFERIGWGTSTVLAETQSAAAANGFSMALLRTLSDVDRPEDLSIWQRAQSRAARPQITVVIPTLNEVDNLPATLAPLKGRNDIEVIVVDGGSRDDTCGTASRYGARVLHSAPGRARQMNTGADAAKGDVLLFLHADTLPPTDFAPRIRNVLSHPDVVAGAFRLKINATGVALRLVEWGANLRSRWFQLPYGDQGIFISTQAFRAAGGFPELPIMEDVEFIRRVRRRGRIAVVASDAVTSARRWRRLGVVRTTLLNHLILTAFFLGFCPNRLVAWYRGGR